MQEAVGNNNNEAFEAYAEEFASLMATAQLRSREVATAATVQDVDDGRVRLAAQLLQQAQELLKQMAVEARGIEDATTKRHYMDRHHVYKSQWQSAKLQSEKEALLSKNGACVVHSQQGLSHERQQQNSAALLAQAARSIRKTEEIAAGVAANLAEQRDTLERTTASTKEVRTATATANQIATNLLKPWWRKGF